MPGQGKDIPGGSLFHDLSGVHHGDLIRQFRHDSQVMGDQEDGHSRSVPEFPEQVEDLGLDGHVEGGGGLVGDQQAGCAGHGAGDHHPLSHASRQLVRILVEAPGRVGDSHPLQPAQGLGPGVPRRQAAGPPQGLAQLVADLQVGGQGRQGVLEDHAHARAAHAVQLRLRGAKDLAPLEAHRAACPAVRRQQAHDRHEGLALSRPALAHDAQSLARQDLQGHAPDRRHGPVAGLEIDAQVLDGQDGARRRRRHLRLRWCSPEHRTAGAEGKSPERGKAARLRL